MKRIYGWLISFNGICGRAYDTWSDNKLAWPFVFLYGNMLAVVGIETYVDIIQINGGVLLVFGSSMYYLVVNTISNLSYMYVGAIIGQSLAEAIDARKKAKQPPTETETV